MELIRELHLFVGATWREIREMTEEAGEQGRKELTALLQEHLGRPDLEEGGLVELLWLAVGAHRAPAPYIYSEDPP